jgi:hypothetical protein
MQHASACTTMQHASACSSFMLRKKQKGFPIFDFPGIDQKPKTTQPSHTIIDTKFSRVTYYSIYCTAPAPSVAESGHP